MIQFTNCIIFRLVKSIHSIVGVYYSLLKGPDIASFERCFHALYVAKWFSLLIDTYIIGTMKKKSNVFNTNCFLFFSYLFEIAFHGTHITTTQPIWVCYLCDHLIHFSTADTLEECSIHLLSFTRDQNAFFNLTTGTQ